MASDFQLDAMLEIDDSQIDDVNNELEATMSGGDSSPAQRDQQESVVAGGVSKGLLAAGVITGILSQLKSITGIVNAVLGAISRALIPIIEKVAEFVRPIVDLANRAQQGQEEAVSIVEQASTAAATLGGSGAALLPLGAGRTFDEPGDVGESVSSGLLASFLGDALGGGKQNAELSDEADKQQTKENAESARNDKTGAFGLFG